MSTTKHHRFRGFASLTSMVVIGAGVVALTGCGSSSSNSATHVQSAQQTPLQSNPDVGQAAAQQTHVSRGAAGSRSASPVGGSPGTASATGRSRVSARQEQWIRDRIHAAGGTQRGRSGGSTSEGPPTIVKTVNPCALVSSSEAQSITGMTIAARIKAPLGPTCVFQFRGSKATITLGLESMSLAQATGHLSHRTRVNIGSRQGYCGRFGTGMLFAPLPSGQVLNVTAPCGLAQRFATLALSRLAL